MLEAEQLLQAALVLPAQARASLASQLLASLPDGPLSDDDEEACFQEVMRRDGEMDQDERAGLSLNEVRTVFGRAARG